MKIAIYMKTAKICIVNFILVGRGGVGAAGGAGSVVLSSSRPAYVPEDLVAQAQSVLQGMLGTPLCNDGVGSCSIEGSQSCNCP